MYYTPRAHQDSNAGAELHPETLARNPVGNAQHAWPELPPGLLLVRKGKEIRLGLRVNLGGAQVEILAGSRPVMTQGMAAKASAEERSSAVQRAMELMERESVPKRLMDAWISHREACEGAGLDRLGDAALTERFKAANWPELREAEQLLKRWRSERAHALAQERVAFEIAKATRIQEYPELFPAFKRKRRFVAVLGPTNSGKTHYALEKLSKAASGVYCGPLRLLSLEVYTRLNRDWETPCSLITGEERRLCPGARHVACTVEMVDPDASVEVTVIDEVQMIADDQRGWAWTQAIVGANADVVYLTGAPNARQALEGLGAILGVDIEFQEMARLSALRLENQPLGTRPMDALKGVKAGDGLVVFSRRDCLALRDCLTEMGLDVAAIYGSLSPEARQAEADRFSSGRAKVLVATDAIGLGLNLKGLNRVILVAAQKFDGSGVKDVPLDLVRQIVGRAGRYGQTPEDAGYACGLTYDEHTLVTEAITSSQTDIVLQRFAVGPSGDILAKLERVSGERRLEVLLRLFLAHCRGEHFEPRVTAECLQRAELVDRLQLPVHTRFMLAQVPVATRDMGAQRLWWTWCKALEAGERAGIGFSDEVSAESSLARLEETVQLLNGYRWLSLKAPDVFPEYEACSEAIARLSAAVAMRLKSKASLGEAGSQSKSGLPAWYWRRRTEDEYF